MADEYDRLERSERAPKRVVDHSAKWAKFKPVDSVNGLVAERLATFCALKQISVAGLTALEARIVVRREGRVELAFAGHNDAGVVTAIKYRPIDSSSHATTAEPPSTWVRPIVVGKHDALDWIVAEGETDAARLYELVGDVAAVMALPAGAKTFKNAWSALIPRGATVALCHDADADGDAGAMKAARIIGGATVRVRPPTENTDWCDWPGSRDDFLELVRMASKEARAKFQWTTLDDVIVKPIVYVEDPYYQAAAFHLFVGIKNAGKGTYLSHLAARVTRGELGPKRHVLWVALGEDSYSIDVKPRILAAGGDPAHVTVLEESAFVLPEHAVELERKAAELGDVAMVVIDPVGGAMQAGKSSNFDSDVRPALQSLNHVADATEAMVFGVRHISIKPERRRDGALAGVLGSSDWVNIPRVVLALVHDDVDKQTRHMFVVAGNRGKEDTPGLMVRIEGHLFEGHEHEVTKLRVLGESAKDPDELLAVRRPRQASKSDAAKRLILDQLHAAAGQQMESDVLDAEIAQRTGLSARTVRDIRTDMRAAGLVRALPEKDSEGEIKRWFVTLTGAGAAAALTSSSSDVSTHNLSRSGLETPDRDLSVSRYWESPDLGQDAKTSDFVTPDLPDDAPGWERAYWRRRNGGAV